MTRVSADSKGACLTVTLKIIAKHFGATALKTYIGGRGGEKGTHCSLDQMDEMEFQIMPLA